MNKIAIFGGSFDPIHRSHIQIAKVVLESVDCKKLIFVVAYAPPHKIRQYVCIEDRLYMLKLATKNMRQIEINLYEAQKHKIVYSYQTLDYFQSLYPKDDIYMVIGSDSLLDLPTWKNIDYLVNHYKFIVVKRSKIEIIKNTKYLGKCILIDKEIENISSTEVRELIKEDSEKAASLLDKEVYNYIVQNKLYK
jgi:nicotinate-nucleotide adenylyltransferase